VTDDEMKLVDAKYDDRAKGLQAKAWSQVKRRLAEDRKALSRFEHLYHLRDT
jgi:hypothetical protein